MKFTYSSFALWNIFSRSLEVPRLDSAIWSSLKAAGIAKFTSRCGCRAGQIKQRPITTVQGYGRYLFTNIGYSTNQYPDRIYSRFQNGLLQPYMQISPASLDHGKDNNVSSTPLKSRLIVLHKPKKHPQRSADSNVSSVELNFCTWNARSIRNKSAVLQDYICEKKIDLVALTETWLTADDAAVRAECTPPGYKMVDCPRIGRGGGGTALVYRSEISVNNIIAGEKPSFEFAEYIVSSINSKIRLLVVYRPPYSSMHPISVTSFIDDFGDYLETIILSPEPLLIAGDFNIHVDNPHLNDSVNFCDLLDSFGLVQHVNTPTHQQGHTLDIVITREADSLIHKPPISDSFLSDHCTVLCNLKISKPPLTVKTITYRKLKTIDIQQFKHDLQLSNLCQNTLDNLDVNTLAESYNSTLTTILDRHAPLIEKSITVRPRVPWFNDNIKEAKRQRRKLERRWRSSGLESDRVEFTSMRNWTTHLMDKARREYYTDFITENCTDQKKLFKAANQLLGRSDDVVYPPHTDPASLANDFGTFFVKKITDIRTKLENANVQLTPATATTESEVQTNVSFTDFEPVTPDYVKKLITGSTNKSCSSDPVPTKLVKCCLDELTPIITKIINFSLEDGCFPDAWKGALVKPMLKKPNADLQFKNFRPVSNLPFLSKLTEKAVANQTVNFMSTHNLHPEFQSAYRKGHSTETALLRVRNDILMNMNRQHVTLLVLLDLSAAFDTIDHDVLLNRLKSTLGFGGNALAWFHSYLSDRFQHVVIANARSNRFDLKFGVPQGSCLGPLLFSIYTCRLFEIVSQHLPQVHCYADDTQLYLAFKPDNDDSQELAIATMEACIIDLRRWMINDKLMINDDKTEFVLIGTKQQLEKVHVDKLSVGDSEITASNVVRNLGSWFDSNLSMASHVNKICKSSFYHLYNIVRIRKFLSQDSTKTLIHAFVTSRLDHCNALLYGLPKSYLRKLQRVQNAAARLVLRVPKFCHISPCLLELHWLPIKFRVDFKIILLTFKAIHGLAPKYISDLINVKPISKYSLRSNNELLLKPPSQKTLPTLGDRAFAAAAPKLWNLLPNKLKDTNSINTFKKELKTYLFRLAFT